jgi:hypothetical protein
MTFRWGSGSKSHRDKLHPDLVSLFDRALQLSPIDLTITESHRTRADHELLPAGSTKVSWEKSKHSSIPSNAGHLDPYPIDYSDWLRYYLVAGVVMSAASEIGISSRIRWGGDWDRDFKLGEETFRDLAHWELVDD